MRKLILSGCLGALVFFAGCSNGPTITEESLGLRKVDLYSENTVKPDGTNYGTAAAGTSKMINRAFENAPPMIPHDVADLGEITKDNNPCMGCHMPEVAPSMKATSIPKSHFVNFRTGEKLKDLYQGRFNCNGCHAPQSTNAPLVENNFTPDFRTNGATANKSNLADVINDGVVEVK